MRDNAEGIVPQAGIPDHGVAADTELLGQRNGGRVCERQLIASRLSRFEGFIVNIPEASLKKTLKPSNRLLHN